MKKSDRLEQKEHECCESQEDGVKSAYERQDGILSYHNLSRREIRSVIFHLLYALETFDYTVSLDEVVDNFNRGFLMDIPLDSQACEFVQAVVEKRDYLDEVIKPLLINWRFDRIGLCTKLILRLAVWELFFTKEPHNIIINEAIELAKCFSETDAYKFINGILDEAVKLARPDAIVQEPSDQ